MHVANQMRDLRKYLHKLYYKLSPELLWENMRYFENCANLVIGWLVGRL